MVWRAESKISQEAKKGCRLPRPPIQPARHVHLFRMGKTEATSRALKKGNTPALAPGQETNASPFGRCRCGPPRRPGRVAVLTARAWILLPPQRGARGGVWSPLLPGCLPQLLSSWFKSLFCGSASVPGETSSGLVLLCYNRVPQTGWLRQQNCTCHSLEAGSPRGVGRVSSPEGCAGACVPGLSRAAAGLLAVFGVSWLRSHSEVPGVRTSTYEFGVGWTQCSLKQASALGSETLEVTSAVHGLHLHCEAFVLMGLVFLPDTTKGREPVKPAAAIGFCPPTSCLSPLG